MPRKASKMTPDRTARIRVSGPLANGTYAVLREPMTGGKVAGGFRMMPPAEWLHTGLTLEQANAKVEAH